MSDGSMSDGSMPGLQMLSRKNSGPCCWPGQHLTVPHCHVPALCCVLLVQVRRAQRSSSSRAPPARQQLQRLRTSSSSSKRRRVHPSQQAAQPRPWIPTPPPRLTPALARVPRRWPWQTTRWVHKGAIHRGGGGNRDRRATGRNKAGTDGSAMHASKCYPAAAVCLPHSPLCMLSCCVLPDTPWLTNGPPLPHTLPSRYPAAHSHQHQRHQQPTARLLSAVSHLPARTESRLQRLLPACLPALIEQRRPRPVGHLSHNNSSSPPCAASSPLPFTVLLLLRSFYTPSAPLR